MVMVYLVVSHLAVNEVFPEPESHDVPKVEEAPVTHKAAGKDETRDPVLCNFSNV